MHVLHVCSLRKVLLQNNAVYRSVRLVVDPFLAQPALLRRPPIKVRQDIREETA